MRGLSAGMIDTLRAEWDAAILEYRAARANLDNAESQLYAWQVEASRDPADWEEWQALFSKMNAIKSTVDALENIAATVSSGWQSTREFFGLSGRRGIAGALGATGAAPVLFAGLSVSAFLILVGKIAAVSAAITAFIAYLAAKTEYSGYIQQRANELVGQGVTPERATVIAREEATTAAQTSTGYTFTTEIRKMLMWSALGIAAVFVVPKLLERR